MGDNCDAYATYGSKEGNALDSGIALAASPVSPSRETCMIGHKLITEMIYQWETIYLKQMAIAVMITTSVARCVVRGALKLGMIA